MSGSYFDIMHVVMFDAHKKKKKIIKTRFSCKYCCCCSSFFAVTFISKLHE